MGLQTTPLEVLCHIIESLDLEDFLRLIKADPRSRRLFHTYRESLFLPILRRDFSPFDGLLRVLAATNRNAALPAVLDAAPRQRPLHRLGIEGVIMDWSRLLPVCAVIKRWEAVFPRLRFAQRPQWARRLTSQETHRLRGAIYNWWCYAVAFHGDLPRPSHWMPRTFSDSSDPRLNMLRTMSTSEMHELRDFWMTLTAAVETEMCPSIDYVRANAGTLLSDTAATRLGWGNSLENQDIVATMLKLSPPDMLHYLCNRYTYSKARLVHDIRLRHPSIEQDREILSPLLHGLHGERLLSMVQAKGQRGIKRRKILPLEDSFPKHHGGILDYKPPWEKLREGYDTDHGSGIRDGPDDMRHTRRLVPPGQLEPRQSV